MRIIEETARVWSTHAQRFVYGLSKLAIYIGNAQQLQSLHCSKREVRFIRGMLANFVAYAPFNAFAQERTQLIHVHIWEYIEANMMKKCCYSQPIGYFLSGKHERLIIVRPQGAT